MDGIGCLIFFAVAIAVLITRLPRLGEDPEDLAFPMRRKAIVFPDPLASTQTMDRTAEKFGFELVRQQDPSFDEQDFRDRVGWLFLKVHHAITDQDLSRIRDFTDDAAQASLQARIDTLASSGHTETFKGLRIESLKPVSVVIEGTEQRVVLHVMASAAHSVVEKRTGRLVLPDTNGDGILRRRFNEAWAMTRPAPAGGVQGAHRTPLVRCPVCGGPVEENRRYVCTYCGTDLRGPEREWTIRTLEFG